MYIDAKKVTCEIYRWRKSAEVRDNLGKSFDARRGHTHGAGVINKQVKERYRVLIVTVQPEKGKVVPRTLGHFT